MTSAFLFFALAFGVACPQIAGHYMIPKLNLPGQLDAFLTSTKNVSLREKVLGTLTGQGTAIFTAIVASDPTNSAVKIKGVEVRLEEEDRKVIVYLDEDGLKPFQNGLTQLLELQDFVVEHLEEYDPAELAKGHMTSAINRVTGQAQKKWERASVLSAGWFWKDSAFGIRIDSISDGRDPRFPGGCFYFPSTSLSKLVGMVEAGRAFLKAN